MSMIRTLVAAVTLSGAAIGYASAQAASDWHTPGAGQNFYPQHRGGYYQPHGGYYQPQPQYVHPRIARKQAELDARRARKQAELDQRFINRYGYNPRAQPHYGYGYGQPHYYQPQPRGHYYYD
jgi:hypothetical protein